MLDARLAPRKASIRARPGADAQKDAGLDAIAVAIERSAPRILPANELDLANGRENGLSDGLLDRLRLDPPRLEGLAAAVREIIALPDPIGETLSRLAPCRTACASPRCACPSASSAPSTRPGRT